MNRRFSHFCDKCSVLLRHRTLIVLIPFSNKKKSIGTALSSSVYWSFVYEAAVSSDQFVDILILKVTILTLRLSAFLGESSITTGIGRLIRDFYSPRLIIDYQLIRLIDVPGEATNFTLE